MDLVRPLRSFLFVLIVATSAIASCGTDEAAKATRGTQLVRTSTPASLHLPNTAAPRTLRVPILMYHRIAEVRRSLPEITQRLTVDPQMFARQMTWLKTHGRHALTQKQLHDALTRGRPLPRHPVLITFDDGYRNVLQNAAPVLARLHMPATAYVITERISGPDPNFLTWRMLRALERSGIEIGSHTATHRDLTSLSDAQARAELVRSKRTLERRLGHPVPWLAYPFGGEDLRIVALARRAGYALAVTTQGGSDQRADDLLRLRRYSIIDTTGVAGVAALVG